MLGNVFHLNKELVRLHIDIIGVLELDSIAEVVTQVHVSHRLSPGLWRIRVGVCGWHHHLSPTLLLLLFSLLPLFPLIHMLMVLLIVVTTFNVTTLLPFSFVLVWFFGFDFGEQMCVDVQLLNILKSKGFTFMGFGFWRHKRSNVVWCWMFDAYFEAQELLFTSFFLEV